MRSTQVGRKGAQDPLPLPRDRDSLRSASLETDWTSPRADGQNVPRTVCRTRASVLPDGRLWLWAPLSAGKLVTRVPSTDPLPGSHEARQRGRRLVAPAPTLTALTAVKTHLRLSYRDTEFPIPIPPTKLNIVGSARSIRVLPVWPSRCTQSLWWSRAVLQRGVGSKLDFQTLK